MAVPKIREILLPLFETLKENNTLTFREATNLVAVGMNLTEEDKNAGTEKSNTLLTNVSFASSELKKKGIMESTERGVWELTEKGKSMSVEEFCLVVGVNKLD